MIMIIVIVIIIVMIMRMITIIVRKNVSTCDNDKYYDNDNKMYHHRVQSAVE